ncbi:MAG TPA: halocyanin domain-containing protein [Halococcus sp.]|nr:halocyanin domain-containing protein [Halococcus sp.]
MEPNTFDRRTVLRGVAGALGASVLAGCSSSQSGSGGSGSGGGGSGGTGSSGGSSGGGSSTSGSHGGTESGTGGSPSSETGEESSADIDTWLADANNYDGSIADMTGKKTVKIAVGAGDSSLAFGPAAVRVSPGTTVQWAWTGKGGAHNVVAKDGAFDSGQPQVGSDITYKKTLDQSGTHLYYCEPHRHLGMKGAVIVGSA